MRMLLLLVVVVVLVIATAVMEIVRCFSEDEEMPIAAFILTLALCASGIFVFGLFRLAQAANLLMKALEAYSAAAGAPLT